MSENLKLILEEFELLKGTQVLSNDKVYRLLAIGDDFEDYYYVLWNGSKAIWSSCVCGVIQLKDKIDNKDYERLVNLDRINCFDQVSSFWYKEEQDKEEIVNKIRKEVETLTGRDSFLTEVCWDLN